MPIIKEDIPYSLLKLRQRYGCSHTVLTGWITASMGMDKEGKPCTVLSLLERAGYKKKQSYLTPKQWSIITEHLDPILKSEL